MPVLTGMQARETSCPHRSFEPCLGDGCMAWVWVDRGFEHAETDNLHDRDGQLHPDGDPPMPKGDGWEPDGPPYAKGYHRSSKENLPKATAQRWLRTVDHNQGQCGLNRLHQNSYGGW